MCYSINLKVVCSPVFSILITSLCRTKLFQPRIQSELSVHHLLCMRSLLQLSKI